MIALFKQHEMNFQTLDMSNNELLVYIQSNFEPKEIEVIEEIENLRKDLIRIWDELIVNKHQRDDVIKMWDLVCLPPNFGKLSIFLNVDFMIFNYRKCLHLFNSQ